MCCLGIQRAVIKHGNKKTQNSECWLHRGEGKAEWDEGRVTRGVQRA